MFFRFVCPRGVFFWRMFWRCFGPLVRKCLILFSWNYFAGKRRIGQSFVASQQVHNHNSVIHLVFKDTPPKSNIAPEKRIVGRLLSYWVYVTFQGLLMLNFWGLYIYIFVLQTCVFSGFAFFSRWWQLKYFLFSPRNLGKMNPIWRCAYFSTGLVKNHQRVFLFVSHHVLLKMTTFLRDVFWWPGGGMAWCGEPSTTKLCLKKTTTWNMRISKKKTR